MKTENIKFKAKELGTGKWKEGFLQRDMDYNLCILIANKEDHSWYWTQIDPSTVCMFTGLRDRDGKEIWEGDILQDVDDDDIKYVVTFNEGTFLARKEGFYIGIPLHECVGSLGNDVVTYAKVVGNKFDKKE